MTFLMRQNYNYSEKDILNCYRKQMFFIWKSLLLHYSFGLFGKTFQTQNYGFLEFQSTNCSSFMISKPQKMDYFIARYFNFKLCFLQSPTANSGCPKSFGSCKNVKYILPKNLQVGKIFK